MRFGASVQPNWSSSAERKLSLRFLHSSLHFEIWSCFTSLTSQNSTSEPKCRKLQYFGFWECAKTQGGRSATYLVFGIVVVLVMSLVIVVVSVCHAEGHRVVCELSGPLVSGSTLVGITKPHAAAAKKCKVQRIHKTLLGVSSLTR